MCNKSESPKITSAVSCIESGENRILVLKETVHKVGVNEPIGVHMMHARIPGYMEEFMHLLCINDKRPDWIVFTSL